MHNATPYADASVIAHRRTGALARLHLLRDGHARVVYADGVTHDLADGTLANAWREAREDEAVTYNREAARLRKPGSYARAAAIYNAAVQTCRGNTYPLARMALAARDCAEEAPRGAGQYDYRRTYDRRLAEGFAILDGRRPRGW